jgi:hypothetical protein
MSDLIFISSLNKRQHAIIRNLPLLQKHNVEFHLFIDKCDDVDYSFLDEFKWEGFHIHTMKFLGCDNMLNLLAEFSIKSNGKFFCLLEDDMFLTDEFFVPLEMVMEYATNHSDISDINLSCIFHSDQQFFFRSKIYNYFSAIIYKKETMEELIQSIPSMSQMILMEPSKFKLLCHKNSDLTDENIEFLTLMFNRLTQRNQIHYLDVQYLYYKLIYNKNSLVFSNNLTLKFGFDLMSRTPTNKYNLKEFNVRLNSYDLDHIVINDVSENFVFYKFYEFLRFADKICLDKSP